MSKFEITWDQQERLADRAARYQREATDHAGRARQAQEQADRYRAMADGECPHECSYGEVVLRTGTVEVMDSVCEDCGVSHERTITFWHEREGGPFRYFEQTGHEVEERFDARPVDFESEWD